MRYRFICEYNGAAFCGWQEQLKNGVICQKTVQSELEKAFSTALRQKIVIVGAGRTDSGVHAKAQVAHFDLAENEEFCPSSAMNVENIQRGARRAGCPKGEMNAGIENLKTLERSVNALSDVNVCVRDIEPCPDDFHARYSAKERYYQYRICMEPVVLGREYLWECGYKLNAELIAKEAQSFLGTHDFAPFCVPRNDGKSTICEIFEFRFEDNIFHIRGNRFLHKQVRAMVGLLVDVGRGRYALGTAERIFKGEFKGERTWAPPQGLVLAGVGY